MGRLSHPFAVSYIVKKQGNNYQINNKNNNNNNVWFQKISIPPPRRELEIPKGRGGGQRPRKFQRGGGCMINLVSRGPLIQYGFQKSFLTH